MANNKYTYIRVDNRGIPTEGERMSYSGKYESDYSQIAKAVMSATEGRARQLSYNVNKRGTSDTIFALPSIYKKQVESAIIKEIEKIQSHTPWAKDAPMYEIHSTKQALELPFKKVSQSAKARAYYMSEAKKHGAMNIFRTSDSVEGIIPVTRENFDPTLIDKSGIFNGKKITFSSFLASKDMQGEYLKNLFASGDIINTKAKEEKKEKEKEKKEKEKEKEKEKRSKELKHDLLKFFVIMTSILTVVKRIFNALMDTAIQRQASAQSGLPLGYTASEMERFARFEKRMSIPEGSIKGTAEKIQSIGANWATLSNNKESLTKLLQALTLSGNEASVDAVTKAFTDLASRKTDVNSVLNTLFKSVAGNWLAKGATQKDYESTAELLKQGGYEELSKIFTAFALHYMKADKETKRQMAGYNLDEWIYASSANVPDNFKQYQANEAFLEFKSLVDALNKAIKVDLLAEFFSLLEKINPILRKWLDFRADKVTTESQVLTTGTDEETGELEVSKGVEEFLQSGEYSKGNVAGAMKAIDPKRNLIGSRKENARKELDKKKKILDDKKRAFEKIDKKKQKGKAYDEAEYQQAVKEYKQADEDYKQAKTLIDQLTALYYIVSSPYGQRHEKSIRDYYKKYVDSNVDFTREEDIKKFNAWLEEHGIEGHTIKLDEKNQSALLPSELYPESSAGGNTTHTLVINVNDSKGERTIASLPLDGVQYQLGKTQLELSQDSRGYEFVQIAGVV